MSGPVWSLAALEVLSLFSTGRRMHGYAVCKETGHKEPTIYTILGRLEQQGLLRSEIDRGVPSVSARIPRVVYEMTTLGTDQITAIRAIIAQ